MSIIHLGHTLGAVPEPQHLYLVLGPGALVPGANCPYLAGQCGVTWRDDQPHGALVAVHALTTTHPGKTAVRIAPLLQQEGIIMFTDIDLVVHCPLGQDGRHHSATSAQEGIIMFTDIDLVVHCPLGQDGRRHSATSATRRYNHVYRYRFSCPLPTWARRLST